MRDIVITIRKNGNRHCARHACTQLEASHLRESTHQWLLIVAVMAASFGMAACSQAPRASADDAGESAAPVEGASDAVRSEAASEHASSEGAGEHASAERVGEHVEGGEHGEHGSVGEGEESGAYIGLWDTWDAARNGARLVLVTCESCHRFATRFCGAAPV
ncbi:MAG: hypothetical protein AMS18_03065 [Gemmatimonas sp. SG8_17]|nr:MAG: hypothetical protein AMS18_03065 [Gemmatimonas sp. SG8_17]